MIEKETELLFWKSLSYYSEAGIQVIRLTVFECVLMKQVICVAMSHFSQVEDLNSICSHHGLSSCDRLGSIQTFWLFPPTVQSPACRLNWQLSPVAGLLSFVPLRWPFGDLWWQVEHCLVAWRRLGSRTPSAILCCAEEEAIEYIDRWIIGNVDWSPLRLLYLYWSSVSNWSRFLFINIRPLLASLLITLLFGLSLHRSLIEWPEVTMLIDWVKITLTWVTHAIIKLGSDLFDTRSMGRQKKIWKYISESLRFDDAPLDIRLSWTRKTWETRKRNFSGRRNRKSAYSDLRSSTKPHAGSQLT